MKWGLTIIIQLFTVLVIGQKQLILEWEFLDANQEIISDKFYATISKGKVLYFADSVESNYLTKFNISDGESLQFQISSPFFVPIDKTILITNKILKKGSLNISFPVEFMGQDLEVVDIRAYYQPSIVYSSEAEHVTDFEMDSLGQLVLVVYEKKLHKSAKLIIRNDDGTDRVLRCPNQVVGLEKDYLNRVYLHTEEESYLVHTSGDVGFEKIDKSFYEDQIKPIASEHSELVFFSNYNPLYPAVDYFAVDKRDSNYQTLIHVEDDEIMEHYRAEYKYVDVRTKLWAWDMEIASGIDREIWVGASVFTNTLYYESPFVPFFIQNDTAYISDHYKNKLYKFSTDDDVNLIDSADIDYHLARRKTGWRRTVLQDPITEKTYVFYDKTGYGKIHELYTNDGSLSKAMPLFYRYVEKVAIYNGEVYYIYRPFGSIQKKYLYKEPLRFE